MIFVKGRIKNTKAQPNAEASYKAYLKQCLENLSDDELMIFVLKFTKYIEMPTKESMIGESDIDIENEIARNEDIHNNREKLRKAAADLNPQAKQDVRNGIYGFISLQVQAPHNNFVVFDKKDDMTGYTIETKRPSVFGAFRRMGGLPTVGGQFKDKCVELVNKYPEKFAGTEFKAKIRQFDEVMRGLIHATPILRPEQAHELFLKVIKIAGELDAIVQDKSIHDIGFDLALIYLIYALNITSFSSAILGAVFTMRFIIMRSKTLAYNAGLAAKDFAKRKKTDAYEALLDAKRLAWEAAVAGAGLAKDAIMGTGKALAGAVSAAASVAYNARAAAGRKYERLMDQESLNSVFWKEVERELKWLRIGERSKTLAKDFKDDPLNVGTHGVNFLNLVFRAPGGIAMALYIPTKIGVGMINERYSFINQVKLGVTGSLLRDKKKGKDFKLMNEDGDTENNKFLVIATKNYEKSNNVSGAVASIRKEKDGYTMYIIAHNKEDCEKLLGLIAKAIKDSDTAGNKITITVGSNPIREVEELIEAFKEKHKDLDTNVTRFSTSRTVRRV